MSDRQVPGGGGAAAVSRQRALVLSPAATHPLDYGNRNRVYQTTRFLKQHGYEVHFLLYPMEGDWARNIPPGFDEMCAEWDSVQVIPPSRPLHQPAAGDFHAIDEWWDPAIGDYLQFLFARRVFDVFLVNYPFLSKALEYASDRTVKVLDVHDVFSGRKEMLAAAGVAPEFFYTTLDQDRIAFERADIVVAIKESERALIAANTGRDVVTLTFYPTRQAGRPAVPPARAADGVLRVGFIGALNSVNSVNMNAFLAQYARTERYYVPPIELRIAGDVCSRLYSSSRAVKLLGRVRTVDGFYAGCDVIVAPLLFSTGLKIKVAEAMGFGLPVVATRNAFDGFPAMDDYHALPDLPALCHALLRLAYDRDRLEELRVRTRLAADLAERRTAGGLVALGQLIAERRRRILFITDRPFWRQSDFAAARLHQWAELSTFLMRTTIIHVGPAEEAETFPTNLPYECAAVGAGPGGIDAAVDLIGEIIATTSQIEIVVATGGVAGVAIAARLGNTHARFWLDLWMPPARDMISWSGGRTEGDIAIIETSREGARQTAILSTVALRYLPPFVDGLAGRPAAELAVVAVCGDSEADRTLAALAAATLAAAGPVKVIGENPAAESLEAGLRRLIAEQGRPRLLLAVGENVSAAKALAAVARCGLLPFAEVSSRSVPRLWPDAAGRMVLLVSTVDLLTAIVGCPVCAADEREEAADTGWSTFWRKVSSGAQRQRG